MEDYGIFASNEDDIRLALVPEDIQDAIDLPAEGWPPYQDLYRRDPPVPVLYDAPQNAGLGGWALWQSIIARQAGISFLGPWKQRALNV